MLAKGWPFGSPRFNATRIRDLASPAARLLRRLAIKLVLVSVIAVLTLIGLAGAVIHDRADGRVVEGLDGLDRWAADGREVPSVVIVPGARVWPDGRPARNVGDRLAVAVALADVGLIDHVLVSGDNRESHYNEPVVMRNWLVDEAGLDPDMVTLDYAGFDTWDTCRRANEQFGVTEAIVVTQELYARRTAALCQSAGIETVVISIDSPPQRAATRARLVVRERLATVKAWFDIVGDNPAHHEGPFVGLVGSRDMPEGGHPPDWNWDAAIIESPGD